jgi:nicotinamide riboside kinase
MSPALVIAIVGAESTGKSTLASALRDALAASGEPVACVAEALREFCDAQGRTPHRHEQAAIAAEQTRRIDAAAQAHRIVVADTTALLTAVYSDFVFGDRSLYASALRSHAACRLTLLAALDLPWVADGLQRDGAHVREPVDALLRTALRQHGPGFSIIGGQGAARTARALTVVQRVRATAPGEGTATAPRRWQGVCKRCGDPGCEGHLLPGA